MSEPTHAIHPPEHPEHHEHKDISFRPLVIFTLITIAFGVVVYVGLYLLFGYYEADERKSDEIFDRSALTTSTPPPPLVPLQGIPGFHPNTAAQDMRALRTAQQKLLATYGPGLEKGSVRIPVDRAMQIIVERQLLPTTSSASGGVHHVSQ